MPLRDVWEEFLVQQEIPGLEVKQERDAHIDHQGALENPK